MLICPSRSSKALLGALCLAMSFVVSVGSARAEGDPLASGTTTLILEKGLRTSLEHSGVALSAKRPTTSTGRRAILPVEGGEIDPTTGKGVATHRGGIGFVRGKRSVFLGSVSLDTKRRVLTAKLAGKRTAVALARKISFVREGYGTRIGVGKLKSSRSWAPGSMSTPLDSPNRRFSRPVRAG